MTEDSSKRTSCRASVQPKPENTLKSNYWIANSFRQGEGDFKKVGKLSQESQMDEDVALKGFEMIF